MKHFMATGLSVVALLMSGCRSRQAPDPGRMASLAAALAEPIEFRSDPGLVDVGPAVGDILTLETAVLRTARHDPRIQTALAHVRTAEAEAHQSRLLPNPVVVLGFRFPTSGDHRCESVRRVDLPSAATGSRECRRSAASRVRF